MFVNDCLNVNEKGHLTIGGCDTLELAKEFGTPLYVMDEDTIRNTCKSYVNSIKTHYDGKGLPMYASKALSCKALVQLADSENMGLDVVSGGEIYTAMKANFPPEKIQFHGNNKTEAELRMALDYNIGKIIVDNLYELELLNKIANEKNKVVKISMRIKPGIDAHTHNFIMTGQIDSKFGFALETGEAMAAVKESLKLSNVDLTELHCHIGSQIFDIDPFVKAAEVMMDFIGQIKRETGHLVTELNLGGGYGIKYTENDNPVPYDNYMAAVSKAVKAKAAENDIPVPFIYMEPGRSVVGEAGITLYTVGGRKEIPNIRTYVSVDGGMTDNIRYALYESEYTVVNAGKADQEPNEKVTVAGKCCESGDLIQKDAPVADVQVGDTLAVLSTGAYNYSMASNYNRNPRPAIVMVKDGKARLIVKRESYDDLVANDLDL
ncbi:diaminopimelate decarboxylase [Oscillospiraceae bacterium LCP25S3_E10]|nr:diaminopimelate decarboxylase [Ruminococcus sp.]MDD6446336.1 diaminopimelate decarboxylase [Ruminococcus sp.]MDY2857016.1 diaminopimelate decarboxylase [Oscillospiraceae bacterium]